MTVVKPHLPSTARAGRETSTAQPTPSPTAQTVASSTGASEASEPESSTPAIIEAMRSSDEGRLFAKLAVGLAMIGSTIGGAVKRTDEQLRGDPAKNTLTTRIHHLQGRTTQPADTVDFMQALKAMQTAPAADTSQQVFADTARAPTTRAALEALPRFQALSPHEQAGLGRVFQLVDSSGGNLYRVLAGRPELTEARSVDSLSTVQQLVAWADTIATMPPGAGRTTHIEAMQSALQDIAIPGRIQQNTKGTCTVTSVQFYVARENPAEYLRLLRELTRVTLDPGSGPVHTMAGDTLQAGRGALDADRSGRRLSERLFQITGMETGNGDRLYLNGPDGHVLDRSAWIKAEVDVQRRWERQTGNLLARETQSRDASLAAHGPDHDLTTHHEAKVQLLTDSLANIRLRIADTASIGRRFDALKNTPDGGGLFPAQAAAVMNSLLNTGLTTLYITPTRFDAVMTVLEQRTDPLALVSMNWSGGGHMLAFERTWVDSTGARMVELRNPWGSWETGRGAPSRTPKDGHGRIVMTGAEFMKHLSAISLRLDGPLPATPTGR